MAGPTTLQSTDAILKVRYPVKPKPPKRPSK
jgi:hypothetical protein